MHSATKRRAAFIDRDGVINEERNYVYRVEDFVFLPRAVDGMLLLKQAGFALVVVTNQAGIARGFYTEADFERLTRHLRAQLSAVGVDLAGVYYCPHHPTEGLGTYRRECDCRKPAPGLLLRATQELSLDLGRSAVIGDKLSDVGAGRAAGVAHCVLVTDEDSADDHACEQADYCCPSLYEAAQWLSRVDGQPA